MLDIINLYNKPLSTNYQLIKSSSSHYINKKLWIFFFIKLSYYFDERRNKENIVKVSNGDW